MDDKDKEIARLNDALQALGKIASGFEADREYNAELCRELEGSLALITEEHKRLKGALLSDEAISAACDRYAQSGGLFPAMREAVRAALEVALDDPGDELEGDDHEDYPRAFTVKK